MPFTASLTSDPSSASSPVFRSNSQIWKQRSYKPKSKTGCKTCRVKCDEGKPICTKCTDFGVGCDGYGLIAQSNKAIKSLVQVEGYRPLLLPRNDDSQLFVCQLSHPLHFDSQVERWYFQSFRDETVPELSGGFYSPVWNQIILQACHEDIFVRDAVVALAALNKSLSPLSPSTDIGSCSYSSDNHYKFALRQYGKALKAMRTTITCEEHLRKAVIGSLLIFCFEGFQGNQDVAIRHVQSTYNLLQAVKKKEFLLPRPTPPTSETIEDDLVHMLERLDLQVMTVLNSKPLEFHVRAKSEGHEWVQQMPTFFKDLEEAHRYWEPIMKRSAHFIYTAAAIASEASDEDFRKGSKESDIIHTGCVIHTLFPPNPIPDVILWEHAGYSSEVMRWLSAFKFQRYCLHGPQRLAANLLQIHALATQIVLDSLVVLEECSFDKYLPQFREIVFLSKICYDAFMPSSQPRTIFNIDFGALPALYTVVKHCRHRYVRREAIALIQSSPRCEGIWQSTLIAAIGEWIMNLEEDEMAENGYIPEFARVRLTKTIVDVRQRTALVECAKRVHVKYGRGLVYRNTTVFW